MKKKLFLGMLLLVVLGVIMFAYDLTNLRVSPITSTSFRVSNITKNTTITGIVIAVDIKAPAESGGGVGCYTWPIKSLAGGRNVTVDVIKDMKRPEGSTLQAVRLEYCD